MSSTPIALGNLVIDRERYDASVAGRRIELTYVEFELLCVLAQNAGAALSRDRLLSAIWKQRSDQTHKLTVHISRLRKKLSDSWPWRIETITKRGYMLRNQLAQPIGAAPHLGERRTVVFS